MASSEPPCAEVRLAVPDDSGDILELYRRIYSGQYTNPSMRSRAGLLETLAREDILWTVATVGGTIVASVVHEIDDRHRLARVLGAVVAPECRGEGLAERCAQFGLDRLVGPSGRVDLAYAAARTASVAPQLITQRLGFHPLGIFPNVHRTDRFETHCLAALIPQAALAMRCTDFRMHPRVAGFYELVREEFALAPIEPARPEELAFDDLDTPVPLELIAAEHFVAQRFSLLSDPGGLDDHFFPFHRPNVLVSSPCQSVELFGYIAASETHCAVVAVKKPREVSLTRLIDTCIPLVRPLGVRYIEVLVRADRPKAIERMIRGRFIPCSYFPALELRGTSRFDVVALSRTFEIVDFGQIVVAERNAPFLREYRRQFEQSYLTPTIHPAGPPATPGLEAGRFRQPGQGNHS